MPITVADQSCAEFDTPNFWAMGETADIRRLDPGVSPVEQPNERPRPLPCQSRSANFFGYDDRHFDHCCFGPRDPEQPVRRGIQVGGLAEGGHGIAAALTHESSVVLDIVVARTEMAMSLNRRPDELLNLARTKLWR